MNRNRCVSSVVPVGQAPPADRGEYKPVILVVDDEVVITDTLAEILRHNGYVAMKAYDGEEALEAALITPPELLISDVILPGMTGVELAVTLRKIFPDCQSLLCSGQTKAIDLVNAASLHGHQFTLLTKPVHPRDILAQVAQLIGPLPAPVSGRTQDESRMSPSEPAL